MSVSENACENFPPVLEYSSEAAGRRIAKGETMRKRQFDELTSAAMKSILLEDWHMASGNPKN
jgi:hypothetical protein